jgi:hypothetical protein
MHVMNVKQEWERYQQKTFPSKPPQSTNLKNPPPKGSVAPTQSQQTSSGKGGLSNVHSPQFSNTKSKFQTMTQAPATQQNPPPQQNPSQQPPPQSSTPPHSIVQGTSKTFHTGGLPLFHSELDEDQENLQKQLINQHNQVPLQYAPLDTNGEPDLNDQYYGQMQQRQDNANMLLDTEGGQTGGAAPQPYLPPRRAPRAYNPNQNTQRSTSASQTMPGAYHEPQDYEQEDAEGNERPPENTARRFYRYAFGEPYYGGGAQRQGAPGNPFMPPNGGNGGGGGGGGGGDGGVPPFSPQHPGQVPNLMYRDASSDPGFDLIDLNPVDPGYSSGAKIKGGKYNPQPQQFAEGLGNPLGNIANGFTQAGKAISSFINPASQIVDTVGAGWNILKDVFGINESRARKEREEAEAQRQRERAEAEAERKMFLAESEQQREQRIKQMNEDRMNLESDMVKDQARLLTASQYGQENAFGKVRWEGDAGSANRKLVSELDAYQQQKKDAAAAMAKELADKDAYNQMAGGVKDSILSQFERDNGERFENETKAEKQRLLHRGIREGTAAYKRAMKSIYDAHEKERANAADHAVEQGFRYGGEAFDRKLGVYDRMDKFVDPLDQYKATSEIGTQHLKDTVLPAAEFAAGRSDAGHAQQIADMRQQLEYKQQMIDQQNEEKRREQELLMQTRGFGQESHEHELARTHEEELASGKYYHEAQMEDSKYGHEDTRDAEQRKHEKLIKAAELADLRQAREDEKQDAFDKAQRDYQYTHALDAEDFARKDLHAKQMQANEYKYNKKLKKIENDYQRQLARIDQDFRGREGSIAHRQAMERARESFDIKKDRIGDLLGYATAATGILGNIANSRAVSQNAAAEMQRNKATRAQVANALYESAGNQGGHFWWAKPKRTLEEIEASLL